MAWEADRIRGGMLQEDSLFPGKGQYAQTFKHLNLTLAWLFSL